MNKIEKNENIHCIYIFENVLENFLILELNQKKHDDREDLSNSLLKQKATRLPLDPSTTDNQGSESMSFQCVFFTFHFIKTDLIRFHYTPCEETVFQNHTFCVYLFFFLFSFVFLLFNAQK